MAGMGVKLPDAGVVKQMLAPLVAWGRHPFSSRDNDLDGQRFQRVGTIKDADGNDLPVWADMWQSTPIRRPPY
jgi:hypothetical protein